MGRRSLFATRDHVRPEREGSGYCDEGGVGGGADGAGGGDEAELGGVLC